MLSQLQARLRPIRFRQRFDRALRWGTAGLAIGAAAGSAWYLAAWLGAGLAPGFAWLLLLGGVVTAAVVGLVWPVSWTSSARLVDAVYGLKDRTLTALDFAGRRASEPVHTLQMADAMDHLSSVDARRVVPVQMPRLVPLAVAATAVMIALGFLPMSQQALEAKTPAGPLEVVLDQAALLEETMIEDLEELAEESEDEELKELAEEMKEAVEELKDPEVDQREALAKLSEMQAAITEAVKALDVEQVDAQLEQLADALEASQATEAASQALKAADHQKSAEELEKIDASTMSKKERDAVTSNLSKLSKSLGKGKKGQLSAAVQEMLEGLSNENDSKSKEGFCKAAGICRKQGLRKKISECLGCQLNRLAECKGCCQGQCLSPSMTAKKSNRSSNKAGLASSNKPLGEEKTKLDSRRRDENLTGAQGDGPSERETLTTAEARQDAARSYRERYVEYRKQMEDVLDSEPLPLGHRETVRKYFEAIRPSTAESELVGQDETLSN
ncbi:MAG: hypothetical protein DWQ37_16090 [Planctomycetota bacterium]|nr:MAG: hypothetical protein DWQ37_16090 [Planctomycetota bacterium]